MIWRQPEQSEQTEREEGEEERERRALPLNPDGFSFTPFCTIPSFLQELVSNSFSTSLSHGCSSTNLCCPPDIVSMWLLKLPLLSRSCFYTCSSLALASVTPTALSCPLLSCPAPVNALFLQLWSSSGALVGRFIWFVHQ